MTLQIPPPATVLGSATYPHRKRHGVLTEVQYAHPDGDNDNDGATWGTAKQTILGAYDALPSTGGTIRFASGTSVGSEVSGQGLWLKGANDSGPLPTGWRDAKRLRLVGEATASHTPNGHGLTAVLGAGSGTDRTKPAIWISGTNVPLVFENISLRYPAVAIRIGLDSDGTSASTNTSNIVFQNCGYELNQIAGNGPGVELGYVFWLWFKDCVLSGNTATYTPTAATITGGTTARFTTSGTHALNEGDTVYVTGMTPTDYNGTWTITAVAATTFDADIGSSPADATVMGTIEPVEHYRRAAIAHDSQVIHPTSTPSGLITIENSVFNGGGFHYSPNSGSSSGRIVLQNITHEGDFSGPEPPTFHLRAAYGTTFGNFPISGIVCDSIEIADASAGIPAVKVDGVGTLPSFVTVFNSHVEGNATVFNGLLSQSQTFNVNRSRLDISKGVLMGHTSAGARAFGGVSIPYTNLAPQDTSTWGAKAGSATVTTGKPAPDGTALAARLSNAGAAQSKDIYRATRTVGVGDWIFAGVWRRLHSGTNLSSNNNFASFGFSNTDYDFVGGTNTNVLNTPLPLNDGAWDWMWSIAKVGAVGAGATDLIMSLRCAANDEVDYYAPVLVHIAAAAALDENEMHNMARYFRTWPDTSPAGAVSTLRGQKLIAWGGLGVGNSAAATTPGSVVRKMEVFSETGASLGFVPIYSSIT